MIHIDPYSKVADYAKLPKADFILITHQHSDHLDMEAITRIQTSETDFVLNEACRKEIKEGIVMHNGDRETVDGIPVEAVPAYNIEHKRDNGQPFHPKGEGNGYVLTFGDTRVYIAGDTENIPELKGLQDIEVAFLPMNLPYTMTPDMAADAARTFKPRILYPYHFGRCHSGSYHSQRLPHLLSWRFSKKVAWIPVHAAHLMYNYFASVFLFNYAACFRNDCALSPEYA